MPFCAFRYRRRYLFPAGLLFFCFLLYDLSGFIWNIEINGNSYLTTETILDFLEEEHASFGTRKSRISCEDLEEAMRSRYRDVIWTSIKIYGTKMTVDIQENLLPQNRLSRYHSYRCHAVAAARMCSFGFPDRTANIFSKQYPSGVRCSGSSVRKYVSSPTENR